MLMKSNHLHFDFLFEAVKAFFMAVQSSKISFSLNIYTIYGPETVVGFLLLNSLDILVPYVLKNF